MKQTTNTQKQNRTKQSSRKRQYKNIAVAKDLKAEETQTVDIKLSPVNQCTTCFTEVTAGFLCTHVTRYQQTHTDSYSKQQWTAVSQTAIPAISNMDGQRFTPNKQEHKLLLLLLQDKESLRNWSNTVRGSETVLTQGYQLPLNVCRLFEINRRFTIADSWRTVGLTGVKHDTDKPPRTESKQVTDHIKLNILTDWEKM